MFIEDLNTEVVYVEDSAGLDQLEAILSYNAEFVSAKTKVQALVVPTISNIRPAGPTAQVVTVTDSSVIIKGKGYLKKPCGGCPWRKDNDGDFPAAAFLHSANTAYDMATHEFGCHESGVEKPRTCAGFVVNGSDHNLASRLKRMQGHYQGVTSGGLDLHESYRAMSVANGVDAHDPALVQCRP